MSGRFRRSYWNFNSRRRFARGRYSGRRVGGLARRARGNQRAANQQNDISNVTINMMKKIKTGVTGRQFVDANDNNVFKDIGTCAINIFELLKKSDFYQSYSNMYDQFRINRIQVKVTPITWQTYNQFNVPTTTGEEGQVNGAGAAYPGALNEYGAPSTGYGDPNTKFIVPQALTVVTAWDRTGLDDTQLTYVDVGNNVANRVYYTTIGDAISTYSSAKSTQLVAGATFNCVRYLYPSSQQEKSLYFSTTDLVDQFQKPTDEDNAALKKWYAMKPVAAADYSSTKITNLHADPNCPFKPTFLIGILRVEDLVSDNDHLQDADYTKGQIYPVTFNLEFDIGVTFRGLRKTQVV